MNNRLTYCGLVDAIISASEKDLPVPTSNFHEKNLYKTQSIIMPTDSLATFPYLNMSPKFPFLKCCLLAMISKQSFPTLIEIILRNPTS